MTLSHGFDTFRAATYWQQPTKLGKGFGIAYPADADKVSVYVAQLAAGNTAAVPPTGLVTLHAQGLVEMLASLAAQIPPASPSGLPMPTADPAGWRRVFADDFTTPVALGSFPAYPSVGAGGNWTAYGEGWKDTSKNGTYSPARGLSIHDGVLDVFLHTDTNGDHVVNNPVPVVNGDPWHPLLGGRFAARWKFDPVPGYKVAWLLWPSSGNWPTDGEIDFPETIPDLAATVQAYMHRQGGTTGYDQDFYDSHVAAAGAWHTSVVEWRPAQGTCAFYLDDVLVGRSTARVPNTAMSWRMQCETNTDAAHPPAASASGHLLVDWVTIHEPV